MKIIFDNDYPVAIGTHGIETNILFEKARFIDGVIIDASKLSEFFIDSGGRKHIVNEPNYQFLKCRLDDELVLDQNIWRTKTSSDTYQEQVQVVDGVRQSEYTQRVRPYLEEAEIKKHMGDETEYTRLMDLAVQEREQIQIENPWPTSPEV
ncbi:hypothetical protein L1D61_04080 [Vibrio mediterranei]|nr:hypothetical protein [Vibrio mediterranei]